MKKKLKDFEYPIGKWEHSVLLWSSNKTFLGICMREPNVIATACAYNPRVAYVSAGLEEAKVEISAQTIKNSPEYWYSIYRNYIYYIGKNTKTVYIKDTVKNTRNPYWITVVIESRYKRLVFDLKEKCYFIQYLIPKDFRIELMEPQIEEILKNRISSRNVVKVTLPFAFPRDLLVGKIDGKYSTFAPMSKKHGWCISTSSDVNSEYFLKANMKAVIEKLESRNFSFYKNRIYKNIMEK